MGRASVILVVMINTRLCPAPGLHLYARLSGDQPPDLSHPVQQQRPCKTIIGCSYCHVIQCFRFIMSQCGLSQWIVKGAW